MEQWNVIFLADSLRYNIMKYHDVKTSWNMLEERLQFIKPSSVENFVRFK